ncbi:MAG TPA: glycosyl hydrolase [Sphingomicrobium sp.]
MALLAACAPMRPPAAAGATVVTSQATPETRALFVNMKRLAEGGKVMFGHHDTLAYGYTWTGEPNRSDIKDVAGAYPAVYGWDVARLFQRRNPDVADPVRAAQLKQWILEGYSRGGVITLAWHMPNPVNDTDSWNTTRAVEHINPGGRLHDDYKSKLDVVAAFLKDLKSADGKPVPVFFRPFHEHTGSWFWWGRDHATVDEFKTLWRFTVGYLRDEKQVRNALYAYSTDVFDSEAAYLERYPGDDVIDLLGFDDYHSVKTPTTRATFVNRLRMLTQMARARRKLAALTETGVEAVPDPKWWTGTLLPALREAGPGISYALVWRNANPASDRKDHFYAPYAGQASAADFVAFKNAPDVLFEDELPKLYR